MVARPVKNNAPIKGKSLFTCHIPIKNKFVSKWIQGRIRIGALPQGAYLFPFSLPESSATWLI
jgi:hypothetical protein